MKVSTKSYTHANKFEPRTLRKRSYFTISLTITYKPLKPSLVVECEREKPGI